ncbi:MAG: carboxypeptidase regulatory-like domain-containing protein [Planctomycetes bacterium]|nr:carboxypeptidase regulatory-like domain-containing protein [Planctomycetota bacterium]
MKTQARWLALAVPVVVIAFVSASWWFGRERIALTPNGARASADSDRTASAPAPADASPLAAARQPDPKAPPEPAATAMPATYLAALGTLTGRLLEPDMTPVVGLPVSVVELEPSRFLLDASVLLDDAYVPPSLETARTTTHDDGRFELVGLEPRAVHLLGLDLGGPRSNFRVIDRSPIPGEVVDLGDIVLEPFVTFIGRIVDEEQNPVAGARVRASNLPSLVFQFGVEEIRRGCGVMVEIVEKAKAFELPNVVWEFERLIPIPTTVSDEEGNFRLPGVPIGMVTVVADKAGMKANTKTQPSGKSKERKIGDLVLSEGFIVQGIVVNGTQTPVGGIDVLVGIRNPAVPIPVALLQPAGRTDGDGRFALKGLPQGTDAYVATRASRGQPLIVHGPFKAIDEDLIVQLTPPSGFIARITGADGKPVRDAELFIAPDPIEGGAPLPPILAPPMQRLTETVEIDDGIVSVAGLDFGKYRLIGRAADYALAQTTIEVTDPPQTFDLTFAQAHTLELTVKGAAEKQPLEWAFASLCPKGVFERPVARGRTNRDGEVALERIPAGKYTLTVQHPLKATQELEVDVPCAPIEVALPLGGNLKGRVHSAGADPGKSLFVIVLPREQRRPDAAMPTFSATADTGHFAVVNLAVGSYRYEIRDRIVGKGALALFETMRDDPLAKGECEIREGETTEVDLDISGWSDGPIAQLFGSVRINGTPTPDMSVRIEGPRKITMKTDATGGFMFEALPAAKCVLTVQGLKGDGDLFSLASVLHREELELIGGESRQLDLALAIAAVSGRVSGPGILPAGLGTTVMLRGSDGGTGQFAMTNPLTGSFEMPYVPAGSYTLLVRKAGAAPWQSSVTVDPAVGNVRVDVELVASVTASGTFALPDGDLPPAPDDRRSFAFLTLVDAAGQSAGRGSVDWAAMSFTIPDAAPGDYQVQLWRGDKVVVVRQLAIPPAGLRDVALLFEAPKPEEKFENPFGAARGSFGGGPPFGGGRPGSRGRPGQ